MPESIAGWLWFTFWFVGSLGGWIVVVTLGGEAVAVIKERRRRIAASNTAQPIGDLPALPKFIVKERKDA